MSSENFSNSTGITRLPINVILNLTTGELTLGAFMETGKIYEFDSFEYECLGFL